MEEYCEGGDDECDGPQENRNSERNGRSAANVNYAEDCKVESREHARETRIDDRFHQPVFGFRRHRIQMAESGIYPVLDEASACKWVASACTQSCPSNPSRDTHLPYGDFDRIGFA